MQISAVLLKPLDGQPESTFREFDKADFERLRKMHAVDHAPTEPTENKMMADVQNKALIKTKAAR